MGSEVMRWLWLVAGVALTAAELATASMLLLPLALGAFAAAAAAFAGGGIVVQLVAAAIVSAGSFVALRPLVRRIERIRNTDGFGARRLVNAPAVMLSPGDVPATGGALGAATAWVKVDGETWPAELTGPRAPEPGERVRVVDVRGTHLVVVPFEAPLPRPTDSGNNWDNNQGNNWENKRNEER